MGIAVPGWSMVDAKLPFPPSLNQHPGPSRIYRISLGSSWGFNQPLKGQGLLNVPWLGYIGHHLILAIKKTRNTDHGIFHGWVMWKMGTWLMTHEGGSPIDGQSIQSIALVKSEASPAAASLICFKWPSRSPRKMLQILLAPIGTLW